MCKIRFVFTVTLILLLFLGSGLSTAETQDKYGSSELQQPPACVPGWTGRLLIDCESTSGWGIEHDIGSTGIVETTPGIVGDAVQLNWDIGTGNWVQARYAFDGLIDLSREDIFGVSLRGDNGVSNRVAIMFRDAVGVFFGFNCDNLSTVDRWMINLSLPKKLFGYFFTFGPDPNDNVIDWSRIEHFYLVVGRQGDGQGGGSGRLAVDHVQADRAGDWPRQTDFESIQPDQASIDKAIAYILSKRNNTGLFTSWSSGAEAYSYDQGLVLSIMSREGLWQNGIPQSDAAKAAKKLADFLVSNQRPAGNWASAWNAFTGNEIGPPIGVGGDAYVAMGLVTYANKAGDGAAWNAAEKCGAWLADQIDEMGRLVASTENNVDAWWVMVALRRWQDADRIQNYLLNTVWDQDLKYWWRGYAESPDPFIALDCATWVGEFAKSSRVNRPDMAKAALSFVHRALMTTDQTYTHCGLDAMGPIGVWCEGTAEYISAGGEGSQALLNTLLALQHPNGGMPSSTEERWNCFGWLSTMTGLAPTSWFCFAQTKSPFADLISDDVNFTFSVTVPPTTPAEDTVYIAGNFNFWDPGPSEPGTDGLNHDLPLSVIGDNQWQIPRTFAPGEVIEYQYTRGSWETVETDMVGQNIDPRIVTIAGYNQTKNDTVLQWLDAPIAGNMLVNGNFSAGETGWNLTVLGAAQAAGAVQNGEYVISISNGGNYAWDINLKQTSLLIENGKTYQVSFDAYAEAPRPISPLVGKNSDPWTVYSGSHTFTLTTSKQTYEYSFTMNDPTDAIARLGFDVGLSTAEVYFDNIYLTKDSVQTSIEHDHIETAIIPTEFRLLQNYPNPFNPTTSIEFALPKASLVTLKIYDLLGNEVATLVAEKLPAGKHQRVWEAQGLASGVYVYRLQAGEFMQTRKLILLR